MGNITLDPYLFFPGNAREAMEFYKSVFGGTLEVQTMNEVPQGAEERSMVNDSNKNQVMFAKLSGDFTLLGSDGQKASPESKKVELSITGDDEAKLKDWFEKLSDGGKVTLPLKKQFWGDSLGMVHDKFGVDWMINITAAKE
ncbi:MAG TPA: VOC family protein [Candidatus Saccharimonadales bacterium]|nr:VOC family protein [Candidatus Saccharimonadales bacterium]